MQAVDHYIGAQDISVFGKIRVKSKMRSMRLIQDQRDISTVYCFSNSAYI